MLRRRFDLTLLLTCAACLALGACASTRAVSFRITEPTDAGEPRAAPGRVIRAVPLNASPAPLPVSIEALRIDASLDRDRLIGASDAAGLVTLRLSTGLPHRIELLPPLTAGGSDDSAAIAWWLSPDAASLEPLYPHTADSRINLDLAK